jgi:PAS domain S-box-containing protein
MDYWNKSKEELLLELQGLQHKYNSLQESFNNYVVGCNTAKAEYEEREETLKHLIRDIPVGILLQGSQSEVLMSNPKALEMLGISEDQLLGKTSFDPDWNVIHEDGSSFPGPDHPVPMAIANRRPVENVVMGVYSPARKNRVWLLVDAIPQLGEGGTVKKVVCSFVDITERKRVGEELKKTEDLFTKAFHGSPSPMTIAKQADGSYVAVNNSFLRLVELSHEEVIGRIGSDLDLIETEERVRLRQLLQEKGVLHNIEVLARSKSGKQLYLLTSIENTELAGEACTITTMLDITERKLAEEKLQVSKTKLETALASMTDAVFISDVEGHFLEFNDAFATFHKFQNKEECAKTLSEYPMFLDVFMANGELAPLEQWAVPRALRGEKVANEEYSLRRKDTGQTWIGSYSFGPICDKQGAIVGSVVVGRDITEQKHAAAAKSEMETKFGAIFNSSPMAFIIYAMDGKLVEVNPAFTQLTGYLHDEVIGKTSVELNLIHPDDHIRMLQTIQHSSGGSLDNFETELIKRDGSKCPVLVSCKIISINGILHRLGIDVDISERKKVEILLQEKSEEIEAQNEEYQQLNEELVQTNWIFRSS